MNFEITQKQDKELLKEHAVSSSDFTFIGKYEWIFAIFYLIIGIILLTRFGSIKLSGLIFIGIGLFELIKFPGRIDRWVNKKIKETIFNKEIRYVLSEHDLEISFEDIHKIHEYQNMRQCMISETGIVFKISYAEYYYISFRNVDSKYSKMELISFLKSRFDERRIKIKNKEYNETIKETHNAL